MNLDRTLNKLNLFEMERMKNQLEREISMTRTMLGRQTDRQTKLQRVDCSIVAAEVTEQLNYTIMGPSDMTSFHGSLRLLATFIYYF